MSEQKAKVAAVTKIDSFPGNDGKPVYKQMIAFDTGVSGIAWTKSEDGSPWKVGEEAAFTLEHDATKGINKLKLVQKAGGWSGGGNRGGGYKKNEFLECASYSLSYAKDMAIDKVIPKEEVLPLAEIWFDWLVAKGKVVAPAPPTTT
jgi:hypothetical protein